MAQFNNKGIEISGTIFKLGETQVISEKFCKREMILYIENKKNANYPDYINIQFTQDRCDLLDQFAESMDVKVTFDIAGKPWSKDGQPDRYFNNLNGYKVEGLATEVVAPVQEVPKEVAAETNAEEVQDLPF